MLQQLRVVGFPTSILSNGTAEMLAAEIEIARLSGRFDHVLSVEQVGVYKPHPKVYRLLCDRLGIDAGAMLFLSPNAWDAHAARPSG
jgi:2-haloacid dehalogenase